MDNTTRLILRALLLLLHIHTDWDDHEAIDLKEDIRKELRR
jgi:hypothetical protein